MPEYLLIWNCGFGEMWDVGIFDSQKEADDEVYEQWRQDAEQNAEYRAELLTDELKEKYGL